MHLFTVGHGTAGREQFGTLLRTAAVEVLVDIRRYPGSRRNQDTRGEALAAWLPEEGIDYVWLEGLGGRRRTSGEPDQDPWWRVEQFRAYAAHTRTPEFGAALGELIRVVEEQQTAIMCSESVWWRCHRRIVADVLVLVHGAEVSHLMHDGRLSLHEPSGGARVVGAEVFWDRVDERR
ncbi:DUF488 family protein [Arthrobacter sp. JZ12]|uniref:DUF488 domain-containing protein n=1 Tax=Arthrobacter sp. JZ12 TaxID=2654190 RepID=UPI002B468ADC|nr:DUF488 domain-containing protein [Arthrobacter sp. JZ12]WRH24131.1 DUF488 family protein [Arthrobacter sp. JZ12]